MKDNKKVIRKENYNKIYSIRKIREFLTKCTNKVTVSPSRRPILCVLATKLSLLLLSLSSSWSLITCPFGTGAP